MRRGDRPGHRRRHLGAAGAVEVGDPGGQGREPGADGVHVVRPVPVACACHQTNALSPVIARPTIRVFISRVPFVGVDRLGVGDEAADVVLEQDAVAAEHLAGPADGLPHPDGAWSLGQRRVLVAQQPGVLQLRDPHAHRGRRGDVGEHLDQQVLDQLEAGDRLAELLARLGVAQRVLVGAAGAADGLPGDAHPGHPQHLGGVGEAARPPGAGWPPGRGRRRGGSRRSARRAARSCPAGRRRSCRGCPSRRRSP